MKIYKIGHARIHEFNRPAITGIVSKINNEKNRKLLQDEISNTKSKIFLIVKGSTQIAGYLFVLQYLAKKYPELKTLVVSKNMSIFGV